jgi:hypothetical protein
VNLAKSTEDIHKHSLYSLLSRSIHAPKAASLTTPFYNASTISSTNTSNIAELNNSPRALQNLDLQDSYYCRDERGHSSCCGNPVPGSYSLIRATVKESVIVASSLSVLMILHFSRRRRFHNFEGDNKNAKKKKYRERNPEGKRG